MTARPEENAPMSTTMRVRCTCGWETTGTQDEVVTATAEHGERIHNMRATRDEIIAMAVPLGED
jgi:hypothetical protein